MNFNKCVSIDTIDKNLRVNLNLNQNQSGIKNHAIIAWLKYS